MTISTHFEQERRTDLRREVDGVLDGGERGHLHVTSHSRLEFHAELGELESQLGEVVGRSHREAAARADDGDALAARQGL